MNDAAVIAAWAAAISSFVGPILAVIMANQMQKQSDRKREASQLFRTIMEDIQKFRHAVLERNLNQVGFDELEKITEELDNKREELERDRLLEQAEKFRSLHVASRLRLDTYEQRLNAAVREVRNCEALLNADKLSLGLLFDKQAIPCGKAINELILTGSKFSGEDAAKYEECTKALSELMQRIPQEMKPLYELLRRADSFSEDA